LTMTGRRVVVADDDALLREGIASLLSGAGYEVVAEAADGPTLTERVRVTVPDVVITDIRMPPTQTWEGLDAARTIRAEFPDIAVLLLSAHIELDTAVEILESGDGVGYLLKSRIAKASELLEAVARVADGGSVIDPALVREVLGARRRTDRLAELTPREREVLESMAEGRSNSGIAAALWVTEGAVEKHVKHILAKLDLPLEGTAHRRVLAVLTFLEAGKPPAAPRSPSCRAPPC
jgi:DNA-binding NarL/FixJ family response regulator